MKIRLFFLSIPICILVSSCFANGENENVVSTEKQNDSVMRSTTLESGVVIIENTSHPHECLDLFMKHHFLAYAFEPGRNLNVSVGERGKSELFSFSVYDEKMHAFCKYWFSLSNFSVIDYDGDGLADIRYKGHGYEIRLNDEWVPCQKIQLKNFSAVLLDSSNYKFKNGKWIRKAKAGEND